MHRFRIFLLFPLVLSLAMGIGCVFKLPTVQGNVLDQEDIDQLEIGMTSNQVRYVLGTPLLEDPFDPRRWDYVYYYRSPKGKVTQRTVTLYFEGEMLASIEGQEAPDAQITEELVEEAEQEAKESVPAERPERKKGPGGYEQDPFEGPEP